jgi:SAM-dependent MidA family methyltransferase
MAVANELIDDKQVQLQIKETKESQERIKKKFDEKRINYDPSKEYTEDDLKRYKFNSEEIKAIRRLQKGTR